VVGAGLSVPPELGDVADVDPDAWFTVALIEPVAVPGVPHAPCSEIETPTMCPDGPVTVTELDSAPDEYL
jgi:hypothetical protein